MFVTEASLGLREVQGHVDALRRLVGRLEPAAVPLADAGPMWQAFDAMARLAEGAKTLLAARVDESGVARRAGDKDTPEYLARRSGASATAARRSLETSKRLARLPQTRQAVRRGELSPSQAQEIADTADKDPAAEQRLLDTAKRTSLGELRRECARTRAQADPDPEATRRRLHRGRWLRRWTDAEGAWNLAARGTPEAGSRFNAVLDLLRDELFDEARREGRREPADAYGFDALIELARRHGARRHADPSTKPSDPRAGTDSDDTPGGDGDESSHTREARSVAPPTTQPTSTASPATPAPTPVTPAPPVTPPAPAATALAPGRSVDPTHLALLRVDWEALVRGWVGDGEVCEIAGVGPVSVAAARALLGESVLKLVITRGVDVVNVTNLGRGPRAAQRIALLWQSPGCTVVGCCRLLGIEHDHRDPWTAVHETATGNLDRLCDHHHDLKTRFGWALVAGRGGRELVPPDDPRHPAAQTSPSDLDHAPPPGRPAEAVAHARPDRRSPPAAAGGRRVARR